MKLRDANLQLYGKNFFTHPPSRILLSFSQNTHDWLLFPKNLWKCTSTISFWKCKWKVVLLIIYPFNYDSSTTVHPSEFFSCWIMPFTVLSSTVSNKFKFVVSCNNKKITRTSFLLLCVLTCTFLAYQKSGTQDPKVGCGTQYPGVGL